MHALAVVDAEQRIVCSALNEAFSQVQENTRHPIQRAARVRAAVKVSENLVTLPDHHYLFAAVALRERENRRAGIVEIVQGAQARGGSVHGAGLYTARPGRVRWRRKTDIQVKLTLRYDRLPIDMYNERCGAAPGRLHDG